MRHSKVINDEPPGTWRKAEVRNQENYRQSLTIQINYQAWWYEDKTTMIYMIFLGGLKDLNYLYFLHYLE